MKTYRSLPALVGVLLGLSATSLIAGPGPQFWQQQDQLRARSDQAKAAAQAAKPATAPAMACASCKTETIREFQPGQAGGKIPARFESVGTKHTCAACGGAVTTVRGNTTDDMTANCPVCAKKTATATCCTAKS